MQITFWTGLFIIFYTYIGYGILLYILVRLFGKTSSVAEAAPFTPPVTIIIAAYNEEEVIAEKIRNTLALSYPAGQMQCIVVTDGSTDSTPSIVTGFPQVQLLHEPARNGKIAAVHRAMQQVTTPYVVFTDANTFLNKEALSLLMQHYLDPTAGAVSGEKRVLVEETADATAGEGIYWKYESKLKKWDAELYTVVGAAGELFSIRTALYQPVPPNTLLDDFMISMMIVLKGYRIMYEPNAYALEKPSADVTEELKRKVRIASGGIQSLIWLKHLLIPFKRPLLSFQYISHRVLRWTLAPISLLLVFLINILLVINQTGQPYTTLLYLQAIFYLFALIGWLLETRSIRVKLLFIPYYFCIMNYAVLAGILRHFSTKEKSGVWERVRRKI
jgi:cellulose synthase/poly-beta-1,6-N-acetylglucosamine synthase-like glycosyltransferase